MSLRAKLLAVSKSVAAESQASGFSLPHVPCEYFDDPEPFVAAVKAQSERTTSVPAVSLTELEPTGHIPGTEYRLTDAAFTDLCAHVKLPVRTIKDFASFDMNAALNALYSYLEHRFPGDHYRLVVDVESNHVLGIVSSGKYKEMNNMDVIKYATSALPGLTLSQGWLQGTFMRFTATAKSQKEKLVVGDPVQFGASVLNAQNGDSSIVINDYCEWKGDKTGMALNDSAHSFRAIHVGNVETNVQKQMVQASYRFDDIAPLLAAAENQKLDESALNKVAGYLNSGDNGGSKAFCAQALASAAEMATNGVITLLNVVKGACVAAKAAPSVDKRMELEGLGYRTLLKFGVKLA